MKKQLFFLFIFFLPLFSFGQNMDIAKAYYIKAKEAYGQKQYQKALDYLKSTKEELKSTNPDITYFEIKSRFGLDQGDEKIGPLIADFLKKSSADDDRRTEISMLLIDYREQQEKLEEERRIQEEKEKEERRIQEEKERKEAEEQRIRAEKLQAEKEAKERAAKIAEENLYSRIVGEKMHNLAGTYLEKYPDGKHRKEVEKIYADVLYDNGVKSMQKGEYRAAQSYFNTYKIKYPDGDKIADINAKKPEVDKKVSEELKRQAMKTEWKYSNTYLMLFYATDGNLGLELGGMDVSRRVSLFISGEGKKPFAVIESAEDDPIPTSGMYEPIIKEYFEEINFTGTLGVNIRINQPLWISVAAGARFDRLRVKKDFPGSSIEKGDVYKMKDRKNTIIFPELGAGVRIGGHLVTKAAIRFIDGDPVAKIGVGVAF